MTTLEAIGFTAMGGCFVSFFSFAAFGMAVRFRSPNIAPRAAARHPDVIYNANSWRAWREEKKRERERTKREREKAFSASRADPAATESRRDWGNTGSGCVVGEGSDEEDFRSAKPILRSKARREATGKSTPRSSDVQNNKPKILSMFSIKGLSEADQGRSRHTETRASSCTPGESAGNTRDSGGNTPLNTGVGFGGYSDGDNDDDDNVESDGSGSLSPAAQYRGWPTLGWIPWSLSLSYDTMLAGVPGTGTRKRGLKGQLLSVNLDAVVLFRFHALCLRVSFLATVLCLGIILPLNLTAQCQHFSSLDNETACELDSLSNYEKTTLNNIPSLKDLSGSVDGISLNDSIVGGTFTFILGRLYAIVFCSWIVTWYSIRLIRLGWVDALAMRRVYYLEGNHWEDRKVELAETLLKDESDSDDESLQRKKRAQKVEKRDPWIPHPEQRDTVPNVELYSVLVEGLPFLPSEVVDKQDIEAAVGFSRRQSIDWQLAVATAFFDHCVPNQPGFSSSVAAVTVLPDAPEMAAAWRKWYVAAKALRRLRFIRSLIAEKLYFDAEDVSDSEDGNDCQGERKEFGAFDDSGFDIKVSKDEVEASLQSYMQGQPHPYHPDPYSMGPGCTDPKPYENELSGRDFVDNEANTNQAVYLDAQRRMKYYRNVFGSSENEDVEAHLFHALNYGPEQSAVYARDFAQSAGACCPNGCGEKRLQRLSIDELLIMERDAIAAVHKGNDSLRYAQAMAAVSLLDTENPKMHLPTKGNIDELEKDLEEDRQFRPLHTNFVDEDGQSTSTISILDQRNAEQSVPLDNIDRKKSDKRKKYNSKNNARYASMTLPSSLNVEAGLMTKFNQSPALKEIKDAFTRSTSSGDMTMAVSNTRMLQRFNNETKDSDAKGIHADSKTQGTGPVKPSASRATLSQGIAESPELPRIPPTPSSISTNASPQRIAFNLNPNPEKMAMAMSADGKFYLRNLKGVKSNLAKDLPEDGTMRIEQRTPSSSPHPNKVLPPVFPGDAGDNCTNHLDLLDWQSQKEHEAQPNTPGNRSGLTRRWNSSVSPKNESVRWNQVEQIIKSDEVLQQGIHNSSTYQPRKPSTGVWKMPSYQIAWNITKESSNATARWMTNKTKKVVDELARESTFAVVTFTNRQAAVAARHCLADGRGADRWITVEETPVPPLADAAACDFITCRGCCRPVTLTITRKQQMLRKNFALFLLSMIYIFYLFPITSVLELVDPENIVGFLPGLDKFLENNVALAKQLKGIVPALLLAVVFALCPVMFKAIANFGSNATSVNYAERSAIKYFWWFIVFTAFSSSIIMDMAIHIIKSRNLSIDLTEILLTIGGSIPGKVAATWINWIIVRATIALPFQYMLQFNSFAFQSLGWKCCRRCVMGGGPGGPIPYRIYIDCGTVFLCLVSLAPASPLVAPCALLYFLYCAPLWRRNCIFIYRPRFDTGGMRWPFLTDILISSLVVGHVLLTTMMALKKALGPAILAALPLIPTLLFRDVCRHRFLKAYNDAGLLQTSVLDGWDHSTPSSMERREEFRQFLVDAHKAAYIPICIAGGATSVLTAEPAVVVPHENDNRPITRTADTTNNDTPFTQSRKRANSQFGVSLRRMSTTALSSQVVDGSDIFSFADIEKLSAF